jgi:two-component system NtrC family sensor kinase
MFFDYVKIHSIRFKLIASLIAVSLLIGLVSLMIGVNLLYRSVLDEAHNRIRQDLNVARVIYDERIAFVRLALEITASSPELAQSPSEDRPAVHALLRELTARLHTDFTGLTDAEGCPILSSGVQGPDKPSFPSANPLVLRVMETRQPVAGTLVMSPDEIRAEIPDLARRSPIPSQGEPQALETPALMVGAAVPVFSGKRLSGILYAGFLLNRDRAIVEKIGETVFKNEIYKGRNIGTATIFYRNLRVATSVKDASGNPAIGTLASTDVTQRVLDKGELWTDRARVLDDWYITAYEPITDIRGQRVGMLYVGVLEAKYLDIRKRAIAVFVVITLSGVLTAIVLGWLFTGRIMRPVSHLIRASAEISGGNFSPDIGPISKDDIGQLQRKFLIMTEALKEREKSQKVESETRLIQSEKQASVGKLAAGVAHEINNPLTAVLTFTHLILRRNDLPDEVRADLETVASQTERVRKIVKSLLDFSRQSALSPEALDVNALIGESITLLENQALIKGITLSFTGDPNLPLFILDHNQCQSVLINMIINALDATPSGGRIDIQARISSAEGSDGVEIRISDTGSGIAPEHMDKLFDPFFTTKEIGKGTGLGLAVSYGIIQRHGGTITVRSKPGKGTTFTLWLPHQTGTMRKDGA